MVPHRIVVMGVSGCGKSTIGRALADRLRVPFVEGDGLHPPENVRRMSAGIALTDADRADWLDAVAQCLSAEPGAASGVVVSCSALKRRYRDRLRAAAPDLRLVFLDGSEALLAARLRERQGHYMPASLLPSQLATLERPAEDENALVGDIADTTESLVARFVQQLQRAR